MGEALAGGEFTGEAAAPGDVGDLDAVLGGDEGGAERAEHPVEGDRAAAVPWSEAVEDVEGVQLGEAHPGPALTGEADVGDLGAGEHPVVVEESAEQAVAFGEPAEDGEQPGVEVPPATTAGVARPAAMRSAVWLWREAMRSA
jgi:hypothetical protein